MTMGSGTVEIKKGREKPIRQQHPWIFSGAIHEMKGNPTPGDIVTVTDAAGRFLARGYWNPKSQIQVRILTWQDEPIDEEWWRRMLERAVEARWSIGDGETNAKRLVNAENDYLPGLIADEYYGWIVIQALTLGIDQRKDMLANILAEMRSADGVYERSDVDVRGKEGLSQITGKLWGEAPPELIEIEEDDKVFNVDVYKGHKTGFYLDQRDNRKLLAHLIHTEFDLGKNLNTTILNLFSYTGGFGLSAAKRYSFPLERPAPPTTNVDISREALELAEKNFRMNGFREGGKFENQVEYIQADVFEYLRDQAAEGNQWDVVVLDPPKFAQSAQQVERAARGYKDINLNAFKCVKPGGYLMTFSCSGAVSADLFQKIVFGALADSGRQAQILKHLGPGDDHPVALTFPEGAYLKGLLLRVY